MSLVATRGSRCHQLLQGGQDVISCYNEVKMSLQLLQRVKMLVTLTRGQDVISGYKGVKVSLQFLQGIQDVITVATRGSRCHYSCYRGSRC